MASKFCWACTCKESSLPFINGASRKLSDSRVAVPINSTSFTNSSAPCFGLSDIHLLLLNQLNAGALWESLAAAVWPLNHRRVERGELVKGGGRDGREKSGTKSGLPIQENRWSSFMSPIINS
ncbi:unnamed protein product [Victoria cruziana]